MTRATSELTASVRSALQARADTIEVDGEPFDPSRPGLDAGLAVEARTDPRSRSPRPRRILAVALVVCVVAAGVAVLVVRRSSPGTRVDSSVGQPDTTGRRLTDVVPVAESAESAPPAIPDGWQVLDYGDFRFAVPAPWLVAGTPACWTGALGAGPIEPGGGLVIARSSPGAPVPTCGPASQLPDSWLVIEGGHGVPPIGPPVPVGTFTAVVDAAPSCLECRRHERPATTYHFDNGYTVSVGGPEAEQILATFTDSGRVRVVQSGPVADTASWQTVALDGVSLEVPPGWPVVDLAASMTETTDASGVVTGGSSLFEPGECASAWFADRQPPQAFTGHSGRLPSCPYSERLGLAPADGTWIRDLTGPSLDLLVATVGELQSDSVAVTVGYPDPSVPAVDVIVTTSHSRVLITIGVGADATVARTILRSIASV